MRSSSVTPLQALALLNDRFAVRQSEHLAERLKKASDDPPSRIRLAYELTLSRPPSEAEARALAGYAAKHGLPNACRLLLNCNEFLFVP